MSTLQATLERKESQASVLQSDLNKSRAECYALKESAIEMKDKMRRAARDSVKASRECEMASSELSVLRRKITSLESVNTEERGESQRLKRKLLANLDDESKAEEDRSLAVERLHKEIESKKSRIDKLDGLLSELKKENEGTSVELRKLKAKEAASVEQNKENSGNTVEVNKLQEKIGRLTDEAKQKDKRIRKLEAVRLTKEQVESTKKMKTDNINFEKQRTKSATCFDWVGLCSQN
jgi:prefoldin subunit 5